MENYIIDKGLFKDNDYYKITIPESITVIENWMRTIKDYSDFAQPNTQSWDEYIQAVFHILEFSLEKVSNRLYVLKETGGKSEPLAIIGIVMPGENLKNIIPGLLWSEFLFYTSNYYKVDWGFTFSGSLLEMFNFSRADYQYITAVINLDLILTNNKTDSFLEFCKMTRAIKGKFISNPKPDNVVENISKNELDKMLSDLSIQRIGLSKRELEIIKYLSTGMTNNEIAEKTKLSDGAVRNYLSSVYKKLHTKNRTEALNIARSKGLI
jgi:DNA-binding CsgD family transcriptional regulator